jgi:hypothetical protein
LSLASQLQYCVSPDVAGLPQGQSGNFSIRPSQRRVPPELSPGEVSINYNRIP